jgi:DNA-binding transcriptional MerR regulator/methanogenic corrinoid protein MtbC1
MSDNIAMKTFNINITSKLTGLSIHTLRAWEKRYNIISPKRNSAGHRVYSEKEVEVLSILNQLCSHGHNISNLKNKSLNELKSLIEISGLKHTIENEFIINDDPINAEKSLNNLLLALEAFRLDVVSHEFYNIKVKLSLKDLALNVISPLMSLVGRKVVENKLSIFQEHALSSIIKFHLGQFLYSTPRDKRNYTKTFILTTPEGDFHEFGILLAGLLCSHYGHKFYYLGPNLPAESIIHAVHSLNADHIIIGSTNFKNSTNSKELDDYFMKVLKGIGNKKRLIVGGDGYFDFSKFKGKKNFEYSRTLNHLTTYLAQVD